MRPKPILASYSQASHITRMSPRSSGAWRLRAYSIGPGARRRSRLSTASRWPHGWCARAGNLWCVLSRTPLRRQRDQRPRPDPDRQWDLLIACTSHSAMVSKRCRKQPMKLRIRKPAALTSGSATQPLVLLQTPPICGASMRFKMMGRSARCCSPLEKTALYIGPADSDTACGCGPWPNSRASQRPRARRPGSSAASLRAYL